MEQRRRERAVTPALTFLYATNPGGSFWGGQGAPYPFGQPDMRSSRQRKQATESGNRAGRVRSAGARPAARGPQPSGFPALGQAGARRPPPLPAGWDCGGRLLLPPLLLPPLLHLRVPPPPPSSSSSRYSLSAGEGGGRGRRDSAPSSRHSRTPAPSTPPISVTAFGASLATPASDVAEETWAWASARSPTAWVAQARQARAAAASTEQPSSPGSRLRGCDGAGHRLPRREACSGAAFNSTHRTSVPLPGLATRRRTWRSTICGGFGPGIRGPTTDTGRAGLSSRPSSPNDRRACIAQCGQRADERLLGDMYPRPEQCGQVASRRFRRLPAFAWA